MHQTLLIQLPIPQLNFGLRTGNVPLAAACLKQAGDRAGLGVIDILSEKTASYLGDAALIQLILSQKPDIIGFTLFNWNVERSIYMAWEIKKEYGPVIVFGGPEMTPDNRLAHSDAADFFFYGQGEAGFTALLEDLKGGGRKKISLPFPMTSSGSAPVLIQEICWSQISTA